MSKLGDQLAREFIKDVASQLPPDADDQVYHLGVIDDGERHVWIEVIRAPSMWKLRRMTEARNTRKETGCGADCTGLVYLSTCKALKKYKDGDEWVAVIECASYYDV